MKIILFAKLLKESFLFALSAIMVNKTRTILSLLGITIGIFSIISVFTVFDSLELKIRSSIAQLGSNVLFIQKWPWAMNEPDYPWWKYMNRPEPTYAEMEEIQRRSNTADVAAFMASVNRNAKYRDKTIESVDVQAVSHHFDEVFYFEMAKGRYFSHSESATGRNVAIIGHDIAVNLFEKTDPTGKDIKVFGHKVNVIGVIKEQGNENFGNSFDDSMIIPVVFARNFLNINSGVNGAAIVVKARENISNRRMEDEMRGIMRSIRRLKPGADDDFAINETSIISKGFDSLFSVVSMVGWIIGGFSLLVGGFGIANIMFVSVKERTSQIGIQKSLGAKKYFIMMQFLFEAVFLSLFGGIVGLIIVFTGAQLISSATGFELILTEGNIILGVAVSIIIGLISGIVPAYNASKLDPVEAMRYSF
ncbi:MAG: ABC transporter permease [Bacteroidales bacterium]|nr:ABC transporter permease [Bacteroidales bacterium]